MFIVEHIGAFIRWSFFGFRKPFREMISGKQGYEAKDLWALAIVNKIIGMATILGLLFLFRSYLTGGRW
jgi:hypothetical protein